MSAYRYDDRPTETCDSCRLPSGHLTRNPSNGFYYCADCYY